MKKILTDENGRVCAIVEAGQEYPVHASLVWRDGTDDVTDRHAWDGVAFAAPPAPEAPSIAQLLTATDPGMARVAEDVALFLLTGAPVPQAAIDKINARRALRGQAPIPS